jgi:ferric-dicitrate binding protein FerR (iron transport regulator)
MNETEDKLEALFEGMQPRTAPPEAARAKALAAATEAFEALVRRRRRRLGAVLAVAATAVGAWLIATTQILPAQPFAVELADASGLTLNGETVPGATRVLEVTPGTRMASTDAARLALGRATDLRLKAGTSVVWLGADRLELRRGSVYVDTGGVDDMTVVTDRGTVSDIGTQFLVSYGDETLEVAMRSGRTRIESTQGRFDAAASGTRGDVIEVSPDHVFSRVEPTSHDRWGWIHAVPRGYESDRVAVLLEKIAGDLGLELTYDNPGTRAWVMNQQLKGEGLDGLAPRQALDVVSSAAGLEVAESQRTLSVALR